MLRFGWIVATCLSLGLIANNTAPAVADASQCYQIQDRDRKNFCLAQAKGQVAYCYQIQDRDVKNVCLAQTQAQKSYCYQIQDGDLKNQCLALF